MPSFPLWRHRNDFFSWSFRCYSDTTANTALYTAQKHSNDTGHLHCNDISNFVKPVEKNLGIYSLIGRTSYRKIWWRLEIARFGLRYFQSLWNLAGTLAPSIHKISLQLRHNGHGSVSNHQPHDCLLNRLFRRKSRKTSKLRVTGLCAGNMRGIHRGPVNSPHKWPVTRKMFPLMTPSCMTVRRLTA